MKLLMRRLLIVLGPLVLGAAGAETPKVSTTLPIEPHTTLTMYADEPVMHRALLRAHHELPEFLEIADTPPRHLVNFSVRVLLIHGPLKEYIWISKFKQVDDKAFTGYVDDDIHMPTQFKRGDPFTFVRTDIADWTYTDTKTGRVHGAYTECALLTLAPQDVAAKIRADHKLDCEF